MNTHMKELEERRRSLVAKAGQQRALAAKAGAGIRAGLGVADRGLALLHHLKHKPLVVGLAAAAVTLLVVKPGQAVKWLGYGFTGYTMLQRARRWAASSVHPDESAETTTRDG